MKILFFGTPAFSVPFLRVLAEDSFFEIVGVVCQPDAPQGRKKILTPPPIKIFAEQHGLPIFQPTKLKEFTPPEADAFVVVAYGKIIPQRILDLSRFGAINVHPSLLPKFRGPSPMQSAIVANEKETGVSIMQLDAEMDHGPIFAQSVITLEALETPVTLEAKVISLAAPLLVQTLKEVANGTAQTKEQDHTQATFCHLLDRKDGIIDWNRPAELIDAQIRGLNPWPGTTTVWERNGKPLVLKVLSVAMSDRKLPPGTAQVDQKQIFVGTATDALCIMSVQPEGGKPMEASAFTNGFADIHNAVLK